MIPGVRGRLISASFARDVLPSMPGADAVPASIGRRLESWARRAEATLGPAAAVRAIADVQLLPLLDLLGYAVVRKSDSESLSWLHISTGPATLIGLVAPWGEPLDRVWRSSIERAIGIDSRWCVCCNGMALRIADATRTWSRDYLEFDAVLLGAEPDTQALFWTLMRAEAMAMRPPLLDRAVELSARHGDYVCRALGTGVLEALGLLLQALTRRRRPSHPPHVLFEQSLTVLYRVLFLLFAEARGLVPMWHPVYRDRYSLDAIVTVLLSGHRYPGLWRAIQAISRLAHAGCTAGELKVTAFNGRLFSPGHVAAFDRSSIDDHVIGGAVIAVSTAARRPGGSRTRIAYRDLDVEQLGAVYEQVLEYQPALDGEPLLVRTRDVRKSSGTFYTPREVTAFLVRRTLAPLVRNRRADDILKLRVVDPAMGSGAFLVAACRFLATAIEEALIREGRWHPHDITAADRIALRREVAGRCLYGVDINPMAVQLARLSLWLATLAVEKPLSFLDHHLVTGNSLIGASPQDVRRQPSRDRSPRRRQEPLPLFDSEQLATTLQQAVRVRLKIAADADDSVDVVRAKERAMAELQAPETVLARWSRVLDLWCAGWFWDDGEPPDRGTFGDLVDRLLRGSSALPDRVASKLLDVAGRTAARNRFMHWLLTFPEVFTDREGEPLANAGFDAVIGNPPWDMLRGDSGDRDARSDRRAAARRMTSFVREAGIYRVDMRAHVNRYQLFVDRALQLVARGGRIGYVLPSGIVSDTGVAPLRRHLFDRAEVDEVSGLDNRDAIFPIHRSMRFALLTCTAGRPTTAVRCRFGIARAEDLDRDVPHGCKQPLILSRRFLERMSGEDDLGIPELSSERDLEIVERISAEVPRLGAPDGWHVQFGRELNASDDRDAFIRVSGNTSARRVVEGKQIEPFRVSLAECRFELRPGAEAQLRVPRRARVAYRDVASATNRLTLIAAIVPARAVTTHTLFCLRTALPLADQQVLCGLLNSFVANYLVRQRVSTHVTVSLVSRLFVPVVRDSHPLFGRLHSLCDALSSATTRIDEMTEYAELQALVARLYGLDENDFAHVLETFPLIAPACREAALARFRVS